MAVGVEIISKAHVNVHQDDVRFANIWRKRILLCALRIVESIQLTIASTVIQVM